MPTYEFQIYIENPDKTLLQYSKTVNASGANRLLAEETLNLEEGEYAIWFGRIIDTPPDTSRFEVQVLLQYSVSDDVKRFNDQAETKRTITLAEALQYARKSSEGIADASQAIVVKTSVLYYPSGSGEPVFYDLEGNEIS